MHSFRLDLVSSLAGLEMKALLEYVSNTFNSHLMGFVDGLTNTKRSPFLRVASSRVVKSKLF